MIQPCSSDQGENQGGSRYLVGHRIGPRAPKRLSADNTQMSRDSPLLGAYPVRRAEVSNTASVSGNGANGCKAGEIAVNPEASAARLSTEPSSSMTLHPLIQAAARRTPKLVAKRSPVEPMGK